MAGAIKNVVVLGSTGFNLGAGMSVEDIWEAEVEAGRFGDGGLISLGSGSVTSHFEVGSRFGNNRNSKSLGGDKWRAARFED